jgi:hypothetical protein
LKFKAPVFNGGFFVALIPGSLSYGNDRKISGSRKI